jgi:hypothetical protein
MRHKLRPSPALVISVISLVVAMSGLAWAAVKIDTPQIKRGAVTAKKIAGGAVGSGKLAPGAVEADKLADGAVETAKLAPSARGVALAGVWVDASGQVQSWFNRSGGKPGGERRSQGRYRITIPGLETGGFEIPVATLVGTDTGEIAVDFEVTSGAADIRVSTADSAGSPQDHGFYFVIYDASSLTG